MLGAIGPQRQKIGSTSSKLVASGPELVSILFPAVLNVLVFVCPKETKTYILLGWPICFG